MPQPPASLCAALIGSLCLTLMAHDASSATASADDLAQRGRAAAWANRHEEAIDAYRAAILAAPARRKEFLLALADQHTWAGRLAEATDLYREAIETLDADGQRRARIGLARALAWQGRHASAISQYTTILIEHPEDEEALRGLARARSWRGQHRLAATQMQAYLNQRPNDREATEIFTDSLSWMGRSDRAASVLRAHLEADPGDQRASAKLADIERHQKPESSVDWRDFTQSDDLEITELSVKARAYVADGRGSIGPRYSLARYTPPRGPIREIQVQRPGLEASYRLSDALQWHGSVLIDLIDTRGAPGDHEHLTYETYATYWPNDLLRFDLGSSRWTFDSEETLRAGLTATQANASMDITPDDRTRFALRFSDAEYSDANQRTWWQLQLQRRVWQSPNITLGYRHTGFDFRNPGQPGYYNPGRYHSDEALLQSAGWIGAELYWNVHLALGQESESPGSSRRIRSGGASVAWQIRADLTLESAYDYSSSRTLSNSGFERSIARLTLKHRY